MGVIENSPLGNRSVAALSQALEDKISRNGSSASTPTPTKADDSQKIEVNDEKKDTAPVPPKDPVTGRVLAEDPRPCLPCMDKGRKCTFLFADSEDDEECAACRRQAAAAGADYASAGRCVRLSRSAAELLALDFEELRSTAAGAAAHDDLDELQQQAKFTQACWEAVVRDHEAERDLRETVYVNGEPITKRDAARMALPMPASFTGKDDSVVGPEGPRAPSLMATRGWRDVLPTQENRSLFREEADVLELVRARRKSVAAGRAACGSEELEERDERIKYLQRIRRYQPREMHLSEALAQSQAQAEKA